MLAASICGAPAPLFPAAAGCGAHRRGKPRRTKSAAQVPPSRIALRRDKLRTPKRAAPAMIDHPAPTPDE